MVSMRDLLGEGRLLSSEGLGRGEVSSDVGRLGEGVLGEGVGGTKDTVEDTFAFSSSSA